MAATRILHGSHRQATYRTLIGVLATTGMRVGEAIRLDQQVRDPGDGVLTIRQGKFGKSRELPLHPSVIAALGAYFNRADRPRNASKARAKVTPEGEFSRPILTPPLIWASDLSAELEG